MPYLSASEVVFHEEALYQVYAPLPLVVVVAVVVDGNHSFSYVSLC